MPSPPKAEDLARTTEDEEDKSVDDDEGPDVREANDHSFASMRMAELLRVDISPIMCLDCVDDDDAARNRPACPCFATLHPFCDLFHTWLCHRLIDDGAGTCCVLPSDVIPDPEEEEEEDEDEDEDEDDEDDDEDEDGEDGKDGAAPAPVPSTSANVASLDD